MSLSEQTKNHLISISTSMAEALNKRDFSPSSPAWKYLAPNFLAGPLPPAMPNKLGVDAYLQHLADMCKEHPDWKLRVVDSDVQQGGNKAFASVYTNVENQGTPVGIVWLSVGISDFQFIEGEWMVVGYRGFSGGTVLGD